MYIVKFHLFNEAGKVENEGSEVFDTKSEAMNRVKSLGYFCVKRGKTACGYMRRDADRSLYVVIVKKV